MILAISFKIIFYSFCSYIQIANTTNINALAIVFLFILIYGKRVLLSLVIRFPKSFSSAARFSPGVSTIAVCEALHCIEYIGIV